MVADLVALADRDDPEDAVEDGLDLQQLPDQGPVALLEDVQRGDDAGEDDRVEREQRHLRHVTNLGHADRAAAPRSRDARRWAALACRDEALPARERGDRAGRAARARRPRAGPDGARPARLAGAHRADLRRRTSRGLPDPAPAADAAPGRVGPRRRLDAGLDRVRRLLAPGRRAAPVGRARRPLGRARRPRATTSASTAVSAASAGCPCPTTSSVRTCRRRHGARRVPGGEPRRERLRSRPRLLGMIRRIDLRGQQPADYRAAGAPRRLRRRGRAPRRAADLRRRPRPGVEAIASTPPASTASTRRPRCRARRCARRWRRSTPPSGPRSRSRSGGPDHLRGAARGRGRHRRRARRRGHRALDPGRPGRACTCPAALRR